MNVSRDNESLFETEQTAGRPAYTQKYVNKLCWQVIFQALERKVNGATIESIDLNGEIWNSLQMIVKVYCQKPFTKYNDLTDVQRDALLKVFRAGMTEPMLRVLAGLRKAA